MNGNGHKDEVGFSESVPHYKTHATIHDFVVLPPSLQADDPSIDDYDKKLISLELTRLHEFARLARNRLETDGAFKMITKLNKLLGDEIAS